MSSFLGFYFKSKVHQFFFSFLHLFLKTPVIAIEEAAKEFTLLDEDEELEDMLRSWDLGLLNKRLSPSCLKS